MAISRFRPILAIALAGIAVAVMPSAQPTLADAPTTARLTITAQGAPMEFRTLGLVTTGFTLADGTSRVFRRLPPGRYVVVQAPPWGGGLSVHCSDDVSNMQYDLVAGDDLTCTFIAGP